MPTYQYACTVASCGHRFEAVQTFTEPALTVCPVCDGGLRKVFSPVGVVFKGSGFYRNDSRGSDSKKAAAPSAASSSSEGKADSSSTSSTEKKSDSTASSTTASSDKSSSSTSTSTSKAAAS